MAKRKDGSGEPKNQSYTHLKWPAIIMGVLVVILIVSLDYCSR